jgi:integrase
VWESGRAISGPKPDGQLGGIIEVMLGTSARIGEVLAIRRRDVDITSAVPSIRITGTIVSNKGEPTQRQDHPKTAKSRRTIAIPTFTAEAVRRRLASLNDASLDHVPLQEGWADHLVDDVPQAEGQRASRGDSRTTRG